MAGSDFGGMRPSIHQAIAPVPVLVDPDRRRRYPLTMKIQNVSISTALFGAPVALTVLIVSFLAVMAPVTASGDCPYESLLDSWQQPEETGGTSAEILWRPGVALVVDHITVCRNGSTVFVRGQGGSGRFAVRFLRANQDSFHDVLRSRYVIEKRVSFGRDREQPTLITDVDGRVTLKWKHRSAEIVGERSIYIPPGDGLSPLGIFMLLYTG
jgi:hypothetical protein